MDDPKTMSLEEMKNKLEFDAKMKVANARKRDVMDLLKALEKQYEAFLRRNAKLPQSQQFTQEDLVLDQRVVADLDQTLAEEMSLVKKRTAWHLEKSKYQFDKMKGYFIDSIETQTLRVHGIVKADKFVETFRLRKLGPHFSRYMKLIQTKIEEQEAKGRYGPSVFRALRSPT